MLQIIVIIALIATMMCVVALGQKQLAHKYFVTLSRVMFIVYVIGLLYCTLLSRVPGSGLTVELIPFMSIVRLFTQPIEAAGEVTGFFAWFMQGAFPGAGIILNILLFLPLGYLLSILVPNRKSRCIILVGIISSIAIELAQYFLEMGYCETDDVIHNTLGTAIGVWIWHLQSKRLNKTKSNELPKE